LTLRNLRINIIKGALKVKRKDLIKKLEAAGYRLDRTGDHAIYEKQGNRPIQVPNHREINEYTARAILKTAGINIK
jgi:mRNA interferase HicA